MATSALPPLPAPYARAHELIDAAHAEDPNTVADNQGDGANKVPYELNYARKMTRFLAQHSPDASPELQLACRAQHFRRWQIPRSAYPATRAGYLTWRARQKTQAATELTALLSSAPDPLPAATISRIAALVRKEKLGKEVSGDGAEPSSEEERFVHEVQALEDVACLVFLSDQFDSWFFATNTADRSEAVGSGESRGGGVEVSEEKMVIILRKTWSKMGRRGRELALQLPLPDRARAIIDKALTSDDEARPPSVTTASN